MKLITKQCPQCGSDTPIDSRFCLQCGFRFSETEETAGIEIPSKRFKGYLLADLEACIGKNFDVYMDKFYRRRKGRITFNWSSAFGGLVWLVYRKMWSCLGICFGIVTGEYWLFCIILRVSMNFIKTAAGLISLAVFLLLRQLIWFLVWGFGGGWLYWMHVKQILGSRQCRGRSPVYDRELMEELEEEGGTLPVGLTIGIAFVVGMMVWCVNEIGSLILR